MADYIITPIKGIKFSFWKDWSMAPESLAIFLRSNIQIQTTWDIVRQSLSYHVFITETQFKAYIKCLELAGK